FSAMVLMNNFDEPTALLPEALRFWHAHLFLFTFITVSIAAAYFANWLIRSSISDYEESTEAVNTQINLKEGGEKLANFLSMMRKRELQTPPTEQSFKAEIERANVRKVRNSGVIVESPKSPGSDAFVSPVSCDETLQRYNFASPQQNTTFEGIKEQMDAGEESSLRLPLEEGDEEDELNIASSSGKIAVFCDCVTNEEPVGQSVAKDYFSENRDQGRRQISAMPAQRRIEQWVNEAAKACSNTPEAVRSPVEMEVTPLRGGGFLPSNFITPLARTYRRKRVTPGYALQKQSLSKKTIHSPTADSKVPPTKPHPASNANGGCFSASISNALISAQQPTTEDIPKHGVMKTTPQKHQAQPGDYLTFAKGLSTFHAVADPQTRSDMNLPSASGHPAGGLQPTSRTTENRLNRGVAFDYCPTLFPIVDSNIKPYGDERTVVKTQANVGVGEEVINVESQRKKRTPKRKQEHINQANSSKRRHQHRRRHDIQQRTGRLIVRKPGRRTEESLLNLFQKMPLDKQQAIIEKCSAKR
uniref:Uncharacterized protein n=1 Tax=Parascaris univalens TaxID=6257 RepID=A0A914ZNJ5_PARUN